MRHLSPLRYPGGKFALREFLSTYLNGLNAPGNIYAEPFVGGAGLALAVLADDTFDEIVINDVDHSIWCFWNLLIRRPGKLCEMIDRVQVNVSTWKGYRSVYENPKHHKIDDIGFATFFLNRTSVSGVIKSGGVIGGLEQSGKYKIDCRFNKEGLKERIRTIAKFRDRITLHNLDALKFIDKYSFPQVFFMIDPPYFHKGSSLYTSFYERSDHELLRDKIQGLTQNWILTYDNCDEIRKLYSNFNRYPFNLRYSLNRKRLGKELCITPQAFSSGFEYKRYGTIDFRPTEVA